MYVAITSIMLIIDLYLALDAYIMITYRGTYFFENEFFRAVFCFYTDILFWFWFGLFKMITHTMKRRKQKLLKKLKLKK